VIFVGMIKQYLGVYITLKRDVDIKICIAVEIVVTMALGIVIINKKK
tara:strand:+ start:19 stop:159 length:141 start_codon:yes stop_codon:yes gene_type:complete